MSSITSHPSSVKTFKKAANSIIDSISREKKHKNSQILIANQNKQGVYILLFLF
jgi:hypothetical protein